MQRMVLRKDLTLAEWQDQIFNPKKSKPLYGSFKVFSKEDISSA
jgi:hypothetical protein